MARYVWNTCWQISLCSARPSTLHLPKAAKLEALLNLSTRWAREFKAEYVKHQDVLRRREKRRVQNEQARHCVHDIQSSPWQCQEDLVASETHHEVLQTLTLALQQPCRLAAWHSELDLVT